MLESIYDLKILYRENLNYEYVSYSLQICNRLCIHIYMLLK
jgi:hypothetical protein